MEKWSRSGRRSRSIGLKPEAYEEMFRLEDRHWWFVGRRAAIGPVIDSTVPDGDAQKILMVGCGTGGNLRLLTPKGKVFALDYSRDAVARAKQRDEATISQASAMALPFADEAFDHVTCLAVFYHSGVTDDVAAMREAWRVCKPGGIFVTTDPAFNFVRSSRHDEYMHTGRRYTKRTITERVQEAGFEFITAGYYQMSLLPIAFLARRLEGLLPKSEKGDIYSDLAVLPSWLNSLVAGVLKAEAALGHMVPLPFGLSCYCVARKPA